MRRGDFLPRGSKRSVSDSGTGPDWPVPEFSGLPRLEGRWAFSGPWREFVMLHQVLARRPEPGAFPPLVSGGQLSRHLFRRKQHQERAGDRIAWTVAAFSPLLACTAVRAEFDPGSAQGIYGSSKREAWRDEAHHCEKHARCNEDFACGWWAVQGSNL